MEEPAVRAVVRRALLAMVVLVGAVLTAGTVQLAFLMGESLAAQVALQDARSAALANHPDLARSALLRAQTRTARARWVAADPFWTLVSHLPGGRSQVAGLRATTVAIDRLTHQVAPPLLAAGERVAPGRLVRGSRVDVASFPAATALLNRALVRATHLRDQQPESAAAPRPVRWAQRLVDNELGTLVSSVRLARDASALAPAALGADGPRRYLVVVQNPAEARGTGGLVGAYLVVTVDDGQVTVGRMGSNTDLHSADAVPVNLGPDFQHLWGRYPSSWLSSNLSPHFPYAAQIWLALWQRQTGQHLDGALALDPVVMGRLLAATGPVHLADGTTLDSSNVAEVVLRRAYERFPGLQQNGVRDRYLISVGRSVVGALLRGRIQDPSALADAVTESMDDHRLLAFSAHPDEQAVVARTGLAGEVPDDPAPFTELVVNNGVGNKLDYYLDRSVTYQLGACHAGRRDSVITVRLTNRAPASGLPAYVVGNPVRGPAGRKPAGTDRLLVYEYLTHGARVTAATLDGRPVRLASGAERGHPVVALSLDLAPGAARELKLGVSEPAVAGTPRIGIQPVVRSQHSVVAYAGCGNLAESVSNSG